MMNPILRRKEMDRINEYQNNRNRRKREEMNPILRRTEMDRINERANNRYREEREEMNPILRREKMDGRNERLNEQRRNEREAFNAVWQATLAESRVPEALLLYNGPEATHIVEKVVTSGNLVARFEVGTGYLGFCSRPTEIGSVRSRSG